MVYSWFVERKKGYKLNHMKLKDFPQSENPYEKCEKFGPVYLSDAELLAIILRTGTRGIDAVGVARNLLSIGEGGLLNLYQLSSSKMMEIDGVGRVKAIQLQSVGEISKRIASKTKGNMLCMNSAKRIADYYMEQYRHEDREHLVAIMLDTKCHFLSDKVISIGTINASLVSPREIFISAMEAKAVTIILLHNHPSGDPIPSAEDKVVTKRITQCGKLLGITLLDHIIIGDQKYYSFREDGLL